MAKTKKAIAAPEAEPTGRKPRLTARQWAEAETLYALGDMSLRDLGNKFNVLTQTIFDHMKRKSVVKGSKANTSAISEAIEKASMGDAAVLAGRIRETKEDHYKMAAGLAKLTWAEILKTKQDGVPFAVATNNLRALDSAMNVLKKAREERYAVLGLDRADFVDEDGLPELVISELTADQVLELQARDNDFSDIPEGALQENIQDDVLSEDDTIEEEGGSE